MAMKLPPPNMLLLLGVGLLVLTMSRRTVATKTTTTPGPVGALQYETPTTVAERLARVVAGMVSPVKPAPPKTDLYVSAAQDLINRWSDPLNTPLSLNGWTAAGGGDSTAMADAVLTTPVYDVGDALAVPLFGSSW